jgi:hypothetical protein
MAKKVQAVVVRNQKELEKVLASQMNGAAFPTLLPGRSGEDVDARPEYRSSRRSLAPPPGLNSQKGRPGGFSFDGNGHEKGVSF